MPGYRNRWRNELLRYSANWFRSQLDYNLPPHSPGHGMRIGDHHINGKVLLAPMAGVSDRPCRSISHHFDAALATGEMVISDPKLWHTSKSQRRLDFQ